MTMQPTIGTSGGNKDLSELWVGTSGGNKQAIEGWVGTAGGNKQFFAAIPTAVATSDGLWTDQGGGVFTCNAHCAATGGVAPYTYAWSIVSGGGGGESAAPTADTVWSSTSGLSLTVKCTVTDHVGNVVSSNTVTIG